MLINYYNARNADAWSRNTRIGNLKQFSETVNYLTENGISTLEELEVRLAAHSEQTEAINASMKAISARKKELEDLLHYADLYRETKPIYDEWKGIKWKGKREKLEMEHEKDLRMFRMARRKLEKHLSPAGKIPVQAWQQELALLQQKYKAEYERYKPMREDLRKLLRILMTNTKCYGNMKLCTTGLSADPHKKGDNDVDQQKITILYCRLSNEDLLDGESNSVQNQRNILTRYAAEHGFTNTRVLVDDGYTGTNFNRPGVQEGLALVEQGLVGAWIVKDMSRFGRDYLQVGRYTEIVFPSYDVRFIAVNDAVDSAKGDNDFTVIRNVFNDFYAKDTSKKVRSVMKAKGTSGKHLGKPPYGYRTDPQNKDHWILDEDAAPVVKRIFDLTIAGVGPSRIARILEADGVLTVKALYAKQKGTPMPERPCHWIEQSVVSILERMEYTGCTCNFKTYSKSYKLKKRIPNALEDMFIVSDTQEAIVPQAQWDRVQELRKNRRRLTKGERQGLFSGLVFCADCGGKLHFGTCKSFDSHQDRYVCSHYKSGRGTCSAHYVREEVLRDVVLERIRAVTEYIRQDVDGFQEEWLRCRREDQEKSIRDDKRQLAKAQKRLADLDVLLTKIYEDMVLGDLTRERYQKMSESYETEQERLRLEITAMEEWVEQREEMDNNLDRFFALTEKYVDIPELTPTIVNEFIKKIIVYAPDNSNGKRTQEILIIFNFLDEVELPEVNSSITVK